MVVSIPILRCTAPALLLAFAGLSVAPPLRAQAPEPSPPPQVSDTLDVDVQIIPFYAMDTQGRPVDDLKPEEIELRVGGSPVSLETLDHYGLASGGRAQTRGSSSEPAPSRNVFFLFDLAFSTGPGLNLSQKLAFQLLEDWPEADHLTLLVHDTRTGFGPRFGPVAAGLGKGRMTAEIKALQPEIRRLNQNVEAEFPAVTGAGRFGGITQMQHNYDSIRSGARSEYHSVARAFADSLENLAFNLRRLPGPKLLVVFSQGLDENLYFNGDSGNGVGSSTTTRVDTRRAPPLVDRFKGPLAALADSGVQALFINGDRDEFGLDSAMRDMAKASGGLYLEGTSPKNLEKEITGTTSAYYEAGFHPSSSLLQLQRASIEVKVRRPGVHAWAPAALRTRESYANLSAYEKRLLVLSLVTGGPGAHFSRVPVRLDFQELDGQLVKGKEAGASPLRFEAAWPAELVSRPVDLYTAVLAPPEPGQQGRVLKFEPYEGVSTSAYARLDAPTGEPGSVVWGIVAIDPQTERVWLRRLMVKPGT